MYHAFVRSRVRALFAAVNAGDAGPVLNMFARRFEHSFQGSHALGGTRTTIAATREWYGRLYRLLPDIRFDLQRIWVSGGPWNTIIVIEWDERNSGTDGVVTTNRGIHAMQLRWGKATRLVICPELPLETTLDRLAMAGTAEAALAPIAG